jgi:hypothetical protein
MGQWIHRLIQLSYWVHCGQTVSPTMLLHVHEGNMGLSESSMMTSSSAPV